MSPSSIFKLLSHPFHAFVTCLFACHVFDTPSSLTICYHTLSYVMLSYVMLSYVMHSPCTLFFVVMVLLGSFQSCDHLPFFLQTPFFKLKVRECVSMSQRCVTVVWLSRRLLYILSISITNSCVSPSLVSE